MALASLTYDQLDRALKARYRNVQATLASAQTAISSSGDTPALRAINNKLQQQWTTLESHFERGLELLYAAEESETSTPDAT